MQTSVNITPRPIHPGPLCFREGLRASPAMTTVQIPSSLLQGSLPECLCHCRYKTQLQQFYSLEFIFLSIFFFFSFVPLFLHRYSRGGRMVKLIFSGNGLSTVLALGTWRMNFGWVMPPFLFPLEHYSSFLSVSLLSVSIWDYQKPWVC